MDLTQNFTLEELIETRHGENTPNAEQIENLRLLAQKVLQPLRNSQGKVHVSSGYRSERVNKLVGGATNKDGKPISQHCKGEAADVICVNNRQAFIYIANNLPFDQLIWEYGNDKAPSWIHVSYRRTGNRKQILRKEHGKGYEPFKAPRI